MPSLLTPQWVIGHPIFDIIVQYKNKTEEKSKGKRNDNAVRYEVHLTHLVAGSYRSPGP